MKMSEITPGGEAELMRARTLLPALALLALAAGCVEAPAETVDASSEADVADAAQNAISTEVVDGDIQVSVATPARTVNYGGAFSTAFTLTEATNGVVLELEWAAATPASEQLSVWVRPAGAGVVDPTDPQGLASTSEPLAQADGASPLRLALPASAFPELGDYDIVVRAAAAPAGVAANQPFSLHMSFFQGLPFDETYSHLGA